MISLWIGLMSASVALADPCDGVPADERTTTFLALQVSLAESALSRAKPDEAGFIDAWRALGAALKCTSEPIDRSLAASIHRVQGLQAWLVGDAGQDRAIAAFAAARALEPSYAFPDVIAPGDHHPLDVLYVTMPTDRVAALDVAAPAAGSLRFDGTTSLARPIEIPTIVQIVGEGGAVDATAYLWPGDQMPSYEARRPPSLGRRIGGTSLAVGGVGAIAGGGVLLHTAGVGVQACRDRGGSNCGAAYLGYGLAGAGLLVGGAAAVVAGVDVAVFVDEPGVGIFATF